MRQTEVLYLASERQWVPDDQVAIQPGIRLILNERFKTGAPKLDQIIDVMCSTVAASQQILLLSFQCHGEPGAITLWDGETAAEVAKASASNTTVFLGLWNYRKLAPFARCMNPKGKVEIHACNVAAAASNFGMWSDPNSPTGAGDDAPAAAPLTSSEGSTFLQGIADVLKVPVTAGVRLQSAMIGFDGPTVTYRPS